MKKILECVPNISEGRDRNIIREIADTISAVDEVKLLHIESGYSANRSVFTFIGSPEGVFQAAKQMVLKTRQLIDMRKHTGVHPRIGAVDVCPFVPLRNVSMEETVAIARNFAAMAGNKLNIPVYCYANAAIKHQNKELSRVRKGGFEGLKDKMKFSEDQPDYGPRIPDPKFGAIAVGAREILVAYNIHLDTKKTVVAQSIAGVLRESGRWEIDPKGKRYHINGKFKHLKAIGWYIEEYGFSQVSMNVTNFLKTPLHDIYSESQKLAGESGIKVLGSEIIGMVPLEALTQAGSFYVQEHSTTGKGVEYQGRLLQLAVEKLGLQAVKPFNLNERILEYRLNEL